MERSTQNKDNIIITQSLVAVSTVARLFLCSENFRKDQGKKYPGFWDRGSLIKFSQNDRKRNRKQRISEKIRESERK